MAMQLSERRITASTAMQRWWLRLMAWSPRSMAHSIGRAIWPANLSVRDALIRLIWVPFWAWSDLPAPTRREPTGTLTANGLASQRLLAMLRSIRRRQLFFRFATLVCRAAVLTILIASVWGIAVLGGWREIDSDVVTAIGLVILIASLTFGWLYRPGIRETARMLDISFVLSDRMTTAVDHVNSPTTTGDERLRVSQLQITEATNTAAILFRHPILRYRLPLRELITLVGIAMLCLAIFLMRGTGAGLPTLGNTSIPAFVSAKDRLQQQRAATQEMPERPQGETGQTVADVQQRADLSQSAEDDLLKIADALDDNPLTASIADAIRAGDYEKAAAELAAVGPDLSQLSPDLRDGLASDLRAAADAMSGEHPDLQKATSDAF